MTYLEISKFIKYSAVVLKERDHSAAAPPHPFSQSNQAIRRYTQTQILLVYVFPPYWPVCLPTSRNTVDTLSHHSAADKNSIQPGFEISWLPYAKELSSFSFRQFHHYKSPLLRPFPISSSPLKWYIAPVQHGYLSVSCDDRYKRSFRGASMYRGCRALTSPPEDEIARF